MSKWFPITRLGGEHPHHPGSAPPVDKRWCASPSWAGGTGHMPVPTDGLDIPIRPQWWETDSRVEGAHNAVFLRYGPVVHCVEGRDHPGLDLHELRVDPNQPPSSAFSIQCSSHWVELHHPVDLGQEG